MIAVRKPLKSKDLTAAEIADLIENFHCDLDLVTADAAGEKVIKISRLSLPEFFNLVKNIPYRRDPNNPPVEVIARPYYLLKYADLGLDCKKKTILLGSYLRYNGIPFRLIGSSQRKDRRIHHIYPEARLNGKWLPVDGTYPHYKLFEQKTDLTKKEVL